MQKKNFEILVQTALTVGLFWTILKLTPKSALLSFTILYFRKTLIPFYGGSWGCRYCNGGLGGSEAQMHFAYPRCFIIFSGKTPRK